MSSQTGSPGLHAPADIGGGYDPFLAAHPAVLVHDVGLDTFEQAWHDQNARCPQCRKGTAKDRGESPANQRRWVRFSCGDVISPEHTAG
jgi:hypothetical protein